MDRMGAWNPGLYYILGGNSRHGVGHFVICANDKIVHDPSLDETGIVGEYTDTDEPN